MNLSALREGVGIAIDALRSNKVRAFLTILGIVIGVATIMAMTAIITGIRTTFTDTLDAAGAETFSVLRWDPTQLTAGTGDEIPAWQRNPPPTLGEAAMIAALPSVGRVIPQIVGGRDLQVAGQTVSGLTIIGISENWPEFMVGDFTHGRNFVHSEVERSVPAVVLSDAVATSLFGERDPSGQWVRIGGHPFQVVGVYAREANIFTAIETKWALIPYTASVKHLGFSTDWMEIGVVPARGVDRATAMDEVTAALRTARGLRPVQDNNFVVLGTDAIKELFDRITGVFFLVMLILSSIGLMVGGVGVVAIMMISVTERTREIGVRKALGATRREILFQFLVEAMTVTVIGGAIGMVVGGAGAYLLSLATPIPATVPLWAIGLALSVFAVSGILFGLVPASRASRLDPVEALRYE
jgi:putative ABC transport system permease protein